MKDSIYILAIFFCFSYFYCPAQTFEGSRNIERKRIDSSAYGRWTSVDGGGITKNGDFACYTIENEPTGDVTLVLKECVGDWEMRVVGTRSGQFTSDNKMAVFIGKGNILTIVRLGKHSVKRIPNVSSFLVPKNGTGEWLVYRRDTSDALVLLNLYDGKQRVFNSVLDFSFSDNGKALVLAARSAIDDQSASITRVDLLRMKMARIWEGHGVTNPILNEDGSQIFFIVDDRIGKRKSIMYYRIGMNKALTLIDDMSRMLVDKNLRIADLSMISRNGNQLFFNAVKLQSTLIKMEKQTEHQLVNIWSYLDEKMEPQQRKQSMGRNNSQSYLCSIDLINRDIFCVTQENDKISSNSIDNEVFLIEHMTGKGGAEEQGWNNSSQISYYVVSVKEKKRTLLKFERGPINLSIGGEFVIYYDKKLGSYLTYEVALGAYRNVTKDINTCWISVYKADVWNDPKGIAGWGENDEFVLVYDRFDIWCIDPRGRRVPINLTNGYGKKKQINFYLALPKYLTVPIKNGERLILNSLEMNTMENGYFKIDVCKEGDPVELSTGPYIYQLIDNPYLLKWGSYPIAAESKNCYLIKRMSATTSPNYFFTSNFKDFIPISNVYPEKSYNWMTSELHTWKKDDGTPINGLLYKPDNFNPHKKYPVIIYFYEKKSYALNEYIIPESISGYCNINIPSFVSNGYLVFSPDIDYVVGNPMQGSFDAVVSAAKYLSELSFIDKNKMGMGGCSFGGVQTNYLITHTNLFAAAYSASSLSDFVSAYGQLSINGNSLQSIFDAGGQVRMGKPLWLIPEMYIKNSAVFNADKVTTPLLLMHTTNDAICPFSQAVEFFTALRRLGKKVWLLEYTDGNHGILGKSAEDFGVRLEQFFDHYLKDKAPPLWMTHGISESYGNGATGFELDTVNKTPGRGLLIDTTEMVNH